FVSLATLTTQMHPLSLHDALPIYGRAVDIHPAAIQNWFKANGRLYGWSWDEGRRVGENWHFRYVPSLDQMKHEGLLDHAAVQRVDRKSTRLNSSHVKISYAVFCWK